ncbi:MAG: CheR family methyltransferase [Planctomycetaceae bacterium]
MEPDKLSAKQFDLFKDFIYRHSGIRMEAAKITLASNRIRRRLKANQLKDFDDYYKFLNSPAGAGEMENFLDAITTNETHFFRTPQHFEWFKGEFVNELVLREQKGERGKQVRVWSAACSSGEEPYSLAICLWENSLRLRDWKQTILGTDISEGTLKDARQAVYKPRSLEEVSEQRLKRHFEADADTNTFALKPNMKAMVDFQQHNLMQPLRLPPFDCIFLRNVLIYFDRESKKVVINNLVNSLTRGGYLVVGPSEGIYDMLDPLEKRQTFLYQKK